MPPACLGLRRSFRMGPRHKMAFPNGSNISHSMPAGDRFKVVVAPESKYELFRAALPLYTC